MAEIIGYLKEDATHGEKRVLDILTHTLPHEFQVYVECPLHHKGMERMPDFIIVTNFGVIVLEVKDWVQVLEADKFYARIRTRSGEIHRKRNPVGHAREFAQILAAKLQDSRLQVPWGYAAVLPNLGPAPITQLRKPWGEAFVLGLSDLQAHVVTRRLKATLPHDRDLRREDLQTIRQIVNPSVSITHQVAGKPRHVTLDEVQERIVSEAPRIEPEPKAAPAPDAEQVAFFDEIDEGPRPTVPVLEASVAPDVISEAPVRPVPGTVPAEVERMTRNLSIRLVRGVAGSGKTLVLIQRARYLAAKHPWWQIAVVTFNRELTGLLQANLKGIHSIKVTNFHSLCASLIRQVRPWSEPCNPRGWIRQNARNHPVVADLGADFLDAELGWIKDVGLASRQEYLDAERRGRGQEHYLPRGSRRRQQIYDLLRAYDSWLASEGILDWDDLPHRVVADVDAGAIDPPVYDALLIDEAQDFAPSWFGLFQRLVRPEGSLLFLVDDPSQSVYRRFSWREKGLPVVGRTRWLRVPYRNTRQIYQAAYAVIQDDEVLRRDLDDQLGAPLSPDLSSRHLRDGRRPELRAFDSQDQELARIRREIEWLLTRGYDAREMVVLHRRSSGVRRLKAGLRGTDVRAATFHTLKGLEFEVVFLAQMQETFPTAIEQSPQAISEERRLVYMAMTRARERLYLGYQQRWPEALAGVLPHVDEVPV